MVNFADQRKNMVESQVRPTDVVDRRIIRAMLEVPREMFVREDLKALAYIDREIPMNAEGGRNARRLLAPSVHARLIQALEVLEGELALEVGCGTGYGSAILARLAQTVVALEVDQELANRATTILGELSIDNVAVVVGPLTAGWPSEGPYDVILVSGAITEPPKALLDQLKDGGRLAAVLDEGEISRAMLWQRSGTTVSSRALFEAGAPILPGFERKPEFVF